MGFFEAFLTLLLLLGGSMGIPMGLPPGPEDPVMAQVAPDNCVLYASWSGIAKIDPAANPTEKWMGQPSVSKAITKLRKAYRGMLLERGQKNDDAVVRLATRTAVDLVDIASTQASAFYLNQFQIQENGLNLKGAVVISLGDRANQITTEFNKLLDLIAPPAQDEISTTFRVFEVAGRKTIKIEIPAGDFPVFVSVWDDYFVAGLGEGSIPQLAANWKTPPPQWLAEMRERLKIDRVASIAYIDAPKIAKEVLPRPNLTNFFMVTPIQELSDEIESIGWVSGLDRKGYLSRAEIQIKDGESSIKSIFGGDPIPRSFLNDLPADPMIGVATRVSTTEILEFVKSTATDVGQKEALNEALQEFQKFSGVKLETELLDAVGDFIYFYFNFEFANLGQGWVASVRINDEMSFPAIFDELNKGLKRWVDQETDWKFEVQKIGQYEVYSVSDPNQRRNNFAWSLIDEQWYFARSPNEIVNHVKGQPQPNQLTNHPSVKEMYEFGDQQGFGGPVTIANLNLARVLKLVHFLIANQRDVRVVPDLDFNWSDIPSLDALTKEVEPNFTGVYRTESGFQMLQRQTYPGASPPVSFFAITAGTLPYAMADFKNSRQMMSENRMRKLGLAMHNYHSAFGAFPAAYSADKNGKPLLSWRVHLLPFLGQVDLYQQFNLDEPWDSDHNKSLIKRMPNAFRHPSLQLPAGKTAYMVPTGDQAVFGPPRNLGKQSPLGKRFADVTDGTVHTAMMIEVNKQNAVDWTAPADIGCDGAKVLRKLAGIRDNGKFSITFCDGSVRLLSASMDQKLMDNILKRNDGNPIRLPDEN